MAYGRTDGDPPNDFANFFRKNLQKPQKRVHLCDRNEKNTQMKNNLNIQLITAAVLSFGGLVMLFCGIFIDPEGEIHETLLIGFGEVATFTGALFGVDYVYKQKK